MTKMNKNLSVQLYTMREESAKLGLIPVLEKVAEEGYDAVEFAGYYGLSSSEIKENLDRLGLKVSGSHTPIEEVIEKPLEVIAFNKEIGNENVIVAWSNDIASNPCEESVKKVADAFLNVVDKYNDAGINLGYHNHDFEFKAKDENGAFILDRFFNATDGKVKMELDTFWAIKGGAEIESYMRANKDIMNCIHLKDGTDTSLDAIGEGDIDIQKVLDLARECGVEWIVVENDEPSPNGFDDIHRSIENLKTKYSF